MNKKKTAHTHKQTNDMYTPTRRKKSEQGEKRKDKRVEEKKKKTKNH